MTKEQATIEAQKVADADGIEMAVTFNPYAEYESDQWGWMPLDATRIFAYEKIQDIITPGGN